VVGSWPLGSATTGEAAVESDYEGGPSGPSLSCTRVLSDLTADDCSPALNSEQPESL